MLKNIPLNKIEELVKIFNACLSLGYFPNAWKAARIKMIPKPRKDQSQPKNHWGPISLLSCIAKTFESSIRTRLVSCLEHRGLRNPYQARYRKGRSTQEHLVRLTEDTYI
jgi:hypothetical protein